MADALPVRPRERAERGGVKAVVYDRYGAADVLELRELPAPAPTRGEILVRVTAAALNPKDSFFRKGRYRLLSGRRFPKRSGVDFLGERCDTGERVFGFVEEVRYRRGTLAEYVCVRQNELAVIPAPLARAEIAGIPLAASTALQALAEIARVAPGDSVCIHGAAGGVGTLAIQIAKDLGAEVTTTSSAANFALCRSLGADATLDYAGGAPFAGGRGYRVVFDVFGNLSLAAVRPSLAPRGLFVTTVPTWQWALDFVKGLHADHRARLVVVRARAARLAEVAALVSAGRLRPVVDGVHPFTEAGVRAAFVRLESKRTRGKLIIDVAGSAQHL